MKKILFLSLYSLSLFSMHDTAPQVQKMMNFVSSNGEKLSDFEEQTVGCGYFEESITNYLGDNPTGMLEGWMAEYFCIKPDLAFCDVSVSCVVLSYSNPFFKLVGTIGAGASYLLLRRKFNHIKENKLKYE